MVGETKTCGRPRRFAKYEAFETGLPKLMAKRPLYCDGIGLFRGANTYTVWLKIKFPHGGMYRGRTLSIGGSIEHKLGKRTSWDWPQLVAERDRLQGRADRGEPLEEAEVPTFAEYAKEWLERKRATLKGFGVAKGHVVSALSPTFGRKALNAISVADVNRWIGQQSSKLRPATVQRQLATFNAIMNAAVRSGILPHNPSERAERIRGIEPRQRFVTENEWHCILRAVEDIEHEQQQDRHRMPQQIRGWLRHYVVWAYHSGMRRGEILQLTLDHVRQISEGYSVVEVVNTKSGKPRFVTCTKEMEAIVSALQKLQRSPNDRRLFPVSMTTLKRSLTNLWKRTGLPDVRLHDLRRTHATILLKSNIDPRTVAGRLGHSGTAMLSKHYAVDLGDAEAAEAFGRVSGLVPGERLRRLPRPD